MATESIAAIFGKVLREQRNARGISQEALALSADVDRTFVSQMERGIRQPTLTTLCKLSEALEIQPSTLVARVEKLSGGNAGHRDTRDHHHARQQHVPSVSAFPDLGSHGFTLIFVQGFNGSRNT